MLIVFAHGDSAIPLKHLTMLHEMSEPANDENEAEATAKNEVREA